MICKECGKEIADGLDYCTECGAPVDEPIVIKMSKDDIKKANKDLEKRAKEKKAEKLDKNDSAKYEGSYINLIGYVKSLGNNIGNLMALIGAILLYISPFLTWVYQKLHGVKTSGNLFDFGSKAVKDQMGSSVNMTITLDSRFFILLAVVILLSGFFMMVLSAREYIKPLWRFRNNVLIRLIPIVTSVISVVLIFTNKHYKALINGYKDLKEVAKNTNSSSVFSYGNGLGLLLCIAGIVIYFLSLLMNSSSKDKI